MSNKTTTSDFIKRCREKHGDKFDYSNVEYINNKKKVCIICNECYTEFWQQPRNHYLYNGCPICSAKNRKVNATKKQEEPKKKEITEEELMTQATYLVLYTNDLSINAINEIECMVLERDKESRRIYTALKKRVIKYNEIINDIIGDKLNFFSELNLAIDELIEDKYKAYTNSIHEVYKKKGIEDAKYLAYVEVARSMTEYAVIVNKKTVDNLLKLSKYALSLRFYSQDEMLKIIENFSDWAYRNVKGFDLNKEGNCLECFRELDKTLSDLGNIESCIKKANKMIGE